MLNADRFIPSRGSLHVDESRYWLKHKKPKDVLNTYLNQTPVYLQDVKFAHHIEYVKQLSSIFGINENRRILPFNSLPTVNRKYDTLEEEAQWPVYARTKPVHKPQYAVLDLPNVKNHVCWNVFNWGSSDYIAAALERIIYLWHVPTATISQVTPCLDPVTCVKFNVTGRQLIYSTTDHLGRNITLRDVEKKKMISQIRLQFCEHKCYVTSADWHPSNKFLVTGCKRGNLCVLTSDLKTVSAVKNAHFMEVVKVKCSPNGAQVATSGRDGKVKIWTLPHLKLLHCHKEYCARGLSWHPWKSSYLCFGSLSGTISIMNTAIGKILYEREDRASIIYDVSFNKITGELAASYAICDELLFNGTMRYYSQINILARLNHAVDRFIGHAGRILYLEWSPDNTVLATAGSDETIHLWKFMEDGQKNIKQKITSISNLHYFF